MAISDILNTEALSSVRTKLNAIIAKINGVADGAQVNTVDSVAGKTGAVTLVKADVGLGSVDNTADSTKSVLQATRLTTARTIGGVSFNGTANINLPGVNTAGNQNTTGSAAKLTTARTIALSGDVTGSVSFDGSANATITAVVVDDSHNHVISNVDGLQTALDGKLSTTGKAADSDKLDGLDSSQFLRSDTNTTLSANSTLTINGSTSNEGAVDIVNGRLKVGRHTTGSGIWYNGAGTDQTWFSGLQSDSATANWRLWINNVDRFSITTAGVASTSAQGTLWGSSNDGAGSGLDADLLDGLHASSFLSTTGKAADSDKLDGLDSSAFARRNGTVTSGNFDNFLTTGMYNIENTGLLNQPYANYGMLLVINEGTRKAQVFYADTPAGGTWTRVYQTNMWHPWEKLVTFTNDGAGSGLDADTLDGLHASSFAATNATATVSGGIKARLDGTSLYLTTNGTNP
jgi:hypothetical protein